MGPAIQSFNQDIAAMGISMKPFQYNGYTVVVDLHDAEGIWSWSYQIDERAPVTMQEPGTRFKERAFKEGQMAAIANIQTFPPESQAESKAESESEA
jgi:hypothetical protein